MDLLEAIEKRHAVRAYQNREIEKTAAEDLSKLIAECNKASGLNMQLVLNEPKSFGGFLSKYGKFSNVTNYIAMVGKKDAKLDELCGYYGEKVVLRAQQLGLNTCWVGLTYSKIKSAFEIREGETLCLVIAIGYGVTQGVKHKTKRPEQVSKVHGEAPDWFKKGVEAALLAPTALNQQKFLFTLDGNTVTAKAGFGSYSKVDLGIAKCHFEIAAGKENFVWG